MVTGEICVVHAGGAGPGFSAYPDQPIREREVRARVFKAEPAGTGSYPGR